MELSLISGDGAFSYISENVTFKHKLKKKKKKKKNTHTQTQKKEKNPPRKKFLYFSKLNFFALKSLIKLTNTVSEATFGNLKKLILENVHFQNCSHKKHIFKIAGSTEGGSFQMGE